MLLKLSSNTVIAGWLLVVHTLAYHQVIDIYQTYLEPPLNAATTLWEFKNNE